MSRRTTLSGLGFLAVVLTAGPAFADAPAQGYAPCSNKPVATSDSENAHTKYIAARQDYDEGNYDSAVRRFRDAYTLDCTKHELLLILSSAYERKGDKKEALSALETYVARVPSSPDMATYQLKIDNLKKDLARQSAAAPATTAAPPPSENRGHTPYPWIVVGIGGAAVATGLAIALAAPSTPANCKGAGDTCMPRTPDESAADIDSDKNQASRAKNLPIAGWSVFGGGLALVVGGLLWHFLEPTGPKKSSAAVSQPIVTPRVSPGFAGLSVGGAF